MLYGDDDEAADALLNEGDEANVETDVGSEAEVEEGSQPKKNESVRESLKRSIKEVEKEENTDKEDKGSDKAPVKKETKDPVDKTDKSETVDKQVSKPTGKVDTPKVQPPIGWTKEAKAEWNKLPETVKASIAKREQEASDGFKQYGEKVKNFEALDQALAPHREEIKKIGANEAQVVSNMFNWLKAIAQPNKEEAKKQFLQLAKNYGIDLAAAPAPKQEAKQDIKFDDNVPEAFKQFVTTIEGKFTSLEEQNKANETARQEAIQREQTARQQAEANTFLNSWAHDKPHYQNENVKKVMFGILSSGMLPLKDGQLDLDSAYSQALYAVPEIREEIQKAEQEEKEAQRQAEIKEQRRKQAEKLNAAKKAGSSISNRAPTGISGPAPHKKGETVSARDSIKAAIQEVRDSN